MQLSDYAQALGAAQRLVPNWREGDMAEAQLQQARMQPQLIQAQIGQIQTKQQADALKAQQDQQQRSLFSQDVAALGANPSADKLYALGVKYPDFAKTINDAAKGVGEGQRSAVVRQLAPIQSLIQNKQYDRAAAEVKRHIDADVAAGNPPDETDQELYAELTSGDPVRQKGAGGIVYGLISAVNPDTAAANIQKQQDSNTHVVSQGGALVGDDGTVLYQSAPAESNALEVPVYDDQGRRIGTRLIANGGKGGDPASGSGGATGGSGGPAAGRTQYGWTPRARNGGDNSDAAVDSKIAGMSKALGRDPDAPLTGMTPLQIAGALTLSEGGPGSIADRNNNPGNLRDPKTGAYRKFATKQEGLQAAAQQVSRNLARGQNTIRTMVEGIPVGGARAASGGNDPSYIGPQTTATGDPSLTGDAYLASLPAGRRNLLKAISEGRAKPPQPGSRFGQALAEDLARAFPDTDTTQFATRQATMTAFAKGKQGDTVRSLNVAIDHLGVMHDAALALRNGNIPLFNKLSQRFQKAVGSPLPTNAKAIAGIVADEVNKAVIGSAGALADRQDLKDQLNVAGSPDQLLGITRSYISLMAGQAKGLQQQYEAGTGNKDFGRFLNHTTAKQLGISRGTATKSAPGPTPAPQGGKLIGMYQGRQVYQLPNGKRVVAK